MFQSYALFPHLSVAGNIAFGLKQEGLPKADIAERVEDMLALVKLAGFGARRPDQLSGGQRQRVALARALVINPTVLLLDEPLSNLDLKLRDEMRIEIAGLQRRLGITTVFVTHDQGEALVMSNRIAVMNAGRIEQIGGPADIYERPATRFVAEFIGRMNFFSGQATSANEVRTVRGLVIAVPLPDGIANGAEVHVTVRPERSRLARDKPETGLALRGTVRQVLYLGATREFHLDLDGGERGMVEMPNDGSPVPFDVGAPVWLTASFDNCLVLPARS